jgi:hypothetical protein
MLTNGRLPNKTDANRPAACPTPPKESSCIKRFNGLGYWPDGNVLECEGSSATLATGIMSNLNSINHMAVSTPTKLAIGNMHAYVFVFPDAATFATVFDAASSRSAAQDLTGNNATTYPNGISQPNQVWYTVLNNSSPDIGSSAMKGAFIAMHEIGHTIDNNTGQPSHSATQVDFDKAVQNDWLDLDYETGGYPFDPRQPCYVKGQVPAGGTTAATYTGPLVNTVDPLTGHQFCASGVLATGEGIWASKKNHEILQQVVNFGRPPNNGSSTQYEMNRETNSGTIGINNGVFVDTGWRELFAQSLAIEAKADITGTSNIPAIDNAVFNGYFGCTAGTGGTGAGSITLKKGWLWYVYNNQALALDASCTANLPAGWTEIQ